MNTLEESISTQIQQLRELSTSEDWSIRERGGFGLRDLMEQHFDIVFLLTESWPIDNDENVRRAACLACMQRKNYTSVSRLKRVLSRLELIMQDDSAYVRKCCGPFVVGYLGYTYPKYTLPWLESIIMNDNVNIRTNVIKAYSQALGRRYPLSAVDVISKSKYDKRLRVRAALNATVRNVCKSTEGMDLVKLNHPELIIQAGVKE